MVQAKESRLNVDDGSELHFYNDSSRNTIHSYALRQITKFILI
jgi:hypothetical protein